MTYLINFAECIPILLAHCIASSSNISVRAGSSLRISADGVVKAVEEAIIHPGYDRKTLNNDVGVLILNERFEYSDNIQAIALNCDHEVSDDTECVVSGWGTTDNGSLPEKLEAVVVNTINKTECQRNYFSSGVNFTLPNTVLCAGVREGRKDSCSGDSVSLSSPK